MEINAESTKAFKPYTVWRVRKNVVTGIMFFKQIHLPLGHTIIVITRIVINVRKQHTTKFFYKMVAIVRFHLFCP